MAIIRSVGTMRARAIIVTARPLQLERVEGTSVIIDPAVEERLREWLDGEALESAAEALGVSVSTIRRLRAGLGM